MFISIFRLLFLGYRVRVLELRGFLMVREGFFYLKVRNWGFEKRVRFSRVE